MSQEVSNESDKLKNSFLYVKLPINLGVIVGQYKIWSRRWVQIECNFDSNLNSVSVNLLVFRRQNSSNIIYRHNFQSENTAIFRCRSRTQTYAFTICDHNLAAIHLATNSETKSQLWMQCFRNFLWPPNPLMEFENSIKGHFYAAIIDNDDSHRIGLLGAYGYLQLSNAKIVLTHSQTGHVIQEWLLSQNTLKNPFENVLQVIRNSSSYSGLQNIYLYCIDANEVMNRINRKKESDICVKCQEELEKPSLTSSSFSVKNYKKYEKFNEHKVQSNSITNNCHTFRIRTPKEIPETMLNCSISSVNNWTTNEQNFENIYSEPIDPNDSSDSDYYEDIDRIYDEITNTNTNTIEINSKIFKQIGPELPPKNKLFSSNPIKIRSFSINIQTDMRDNQSVSYDMFSKVVRQTNISLLNTQRLSNKSVNPLTDFLEKDVPKRESELNYYVMKPILNKPMINKTNHSENDVYVDMKSFSI